MGLEGEPQFGIGFCACVARHEARALRSEGAAAALRGFCVVDIFAGLDLDGRSLLLTAGAASGTPTKRRFTAVDLMGECIGVFHRPREEARIDQNS